MGALREWILTLAGAAAFCAVANAICPKGRVRNVLGLVCGAVMTLALVSPILDFNMDAYSAALSRYRTEAELALSDAGEKGAALERTIIEEECAAYILDKAESLGMTSAAASVRVRWNGEGGWAPDEATIRAAGTETQRAELRHRVEAELGIPAERQYWEAG